MAISYNCPHCGQRFDVRDDLAGETGSCASCGETLTVPDPNNRFTGAAASDTFRFKPGFWGVVFVGGSFLMLLCLLLPAVRTVSERPRKNYCINNLKNLGLAMHNHHDVHQRLPLASSESRSGQPGQINGPNPAGYGWTVALLPFLEEQALWDRLAKSSSGWQVPPFDPQVTPVYATVPIGLLRCTSGAGLEHVRTAETEYQEHPTSAGMLPPARSTYVAFAASHVTNTTGSGAAQLFDASLGGGEYDGNGIIPFPKSTGSFHEGLGLNAATDGTSKTVMLCETREQGYAAWVDGQATWVVGAWPGNAQVPDVTQTADGFLGWSDEDARSRTALNVGQPHNSTKGDAYMTAAQYGAQFDRRWGPSSHHEYGAVNHVFVDGHVQSIVPDRIDRNVYLRAISRAGGEPIDTDW